MVRLSSPQELEKYRNEILSARDPNQAFITSVVERGVMFQDVTRWWMPSKRSFKRRPKVMALAFSNRLSRLLRERAFSRILSKKGLVSRGEA